ncbi:dienelactone hydrolase family protein [Pseudomonas extremaustralis]|jgi:dienelactone hydrolase|uniref:Alpha/beta hydrolase n=1 Tax=Pseudomonas extremaustralis TaxID=359110 RepID=A0A5C5QPI3_9PSED|nr:dienelactone hydrolase family protein [Pseudomonas extremaustralis]EZI30118.1 DeoR faimly transcriptional regulator [Pseudomonas extremaustralis 14-3 substr. 14-3b]MDB1111066.1 dienelactone hydrolase family protein [Pseudomonas extremaustralis]MDF3133262.1 dienelactone hydrolase family protein [Pseudomonas extremaustralis]MDG2965566.1 dienelactone hydrolase family protein [Pseudomonas extremaustralis]MDY7066476.1 putative phosphoribosyl transferase [Pseudomonas extremaustralis]
MASPFGVSGSELQYRKFNFSGFELAGDLRLPQGTDCLVILVHGSGGGHSNPRNHYIAEYLARHGMGTLVVDLLTRTEQRWDNLTGVLRFDIPLLADRLSQVIDATARDTQLRKLGVGLFGASTGAAAVLVAAARSPSVQAVVSRGGRTDLAAEALPLVSAPTLQVVGGEDPMILRLNVQTCQTLHCEQRLEVIEGATHLFKEPGALADVARLTGNWFEQYLHKEHTCTS